MNTYIVRNNSCGSGKNAGAKAPNDINTICQELGWHKFAMKMASRGMKKIFYSVLCTPFQWMELGRLSKGYVLYQYPTYGSTKIASIMIPIIQKIFGSKIIVLIHDLESLRYHKSNREVQLIDSCSYVICHNHRMKDYLISKGVSSVKIVELGVFDYLCEKTQKIQNNPIKNSVAIEGNLSPDKCRYIYKFVENNPALKIDLYGVGYEKKAEYSNAEYHGSFSPEELPIRIDSAYGLVWDGPEIASCSGNYGEYLKYNNPHKFSLYMAAGIPVITWKQAAIADFVKKYQVGIVVDSLINLSDTLNQISDEQYITMKTNAETIGTKLKEGFYLKKALQAIFDIDALKTRRGL